MPPPLIGITTYGLDEKGVYSLPALYVECVRRAGGIPLLIPPGNSNLEDILRVLSGVVLAGGGDIDPKHYQGAQNNSIYGVNAERDTSEIELVRHLLKIGLPTLAICRGMQVVNTALGGTLIEDVPSEIGTKIVHRAPPRNPIEHEIVITTESRLFSILNTDKAVAASWHHQALRKVAGGFKVAATAADGTIEAIESQSYPNLIAIQWHPELTAAQDPVQQNLFNKLIALTNLKKT
jgi:putative glutamine amidotransferase